MNHLHHRLSTVLLLAALALWTGCSADSDGGETATAGSAIAFSADVEGAVTRTGAVGVMNTMTLRDTGFGVFTFSSTEGYSTDWLSGAEVKYEDVSDELSDDLHLHPSNWSYGTVKDWPADGTKISFLAYAPYVGTPGGDTGITGVSEGGKDPTVSYTVATSPAESVDLLWGINGETGLPWGKYKKEGVTDLYGVNYSDLKGPVLFTFCHALAAIGFHVQAMVDKDNDTSDFDDESAVAKLLGESGKYKITIKQLTMTGKTDDDKFYSKGTLHLNNKTPNEPEWDLSDDDLKKKTLTVDNSLITGYMQHPEPNVEVKTLPSDAKTKIMDVASITGVIQEAKQLLIAKAGEKEQCFFVIPNSKKQDYTVQLDWCISGQAPDDTYIAQDRTSTIYINELELKAGIRYYLNFVLGLKTLKLSVDAADWENKSQPVTVTTERGTSASSSLAPRH